MKTTFTNPVSGLAPDIPVERENSANSRNSKSVRFKGVEPVPNRQLTCFRRYVLPCLDKSLMKNPCIQYLNKRAIEETKLFNSELQETRKSVDTLSTAHKQMLWISSYIGKLNRLSHDMDNEVSDRANIILAFIQKSGQHLDSFKEAPNTTSGGRHLERLADRFALNAFKTGSSNDVFDILEEEAGLLRQLFQCAFEIKPILNQLVSEARRLERSNEQGAAANKDRVVETNEQGVESERSITESFRSVTGWSSINSLSSRDTQERISHPNKNDEPITVLANKEMEMIELEVSLESAITDLNLWSIVVREDLTDKLTSLFADTEGENLLDAILNIKRSKSLENLSTKCGEQTEMSYLALLDDLDPSIRRVSSYSRVHSLRSGETHQSMNFSNSMPNLLSSSSLEH